MESSAKVLMLSLLMFSAIMMASLYIGQCTSACRAAPYSYIFGLPLSLIALFLFAAAFIAELSNSRIGPLLVLPTVLYGYFIGIIALIKYSYICPYCELAKASALTYLLLDWNNLSSLLRMVASRITNL